MSVMAESTLVDIHRREIKISGNALDWSRLSNLCKEVMQDFEHDSDAEKIREKVLHEPQDDEL